MFLFLFFSAAAVRASGKILDQWPGFLPFISSQIPRFTHGTLHCKHSGPLEQSVVLVKVMVIVPGYIVLHNLCKQELL